MSEQSQQAILSYLKMFASFDSGPGPIGRFTLDHGHFWTSACLPAGFKKGRSKACFRNAFDILKRGGEGLTYVEGYAISGTLRVALPIHHAWIVERDGTVIDNTWEQPENAIYFGVPFHTAYVTSVWHRYNRDVSMLDNFADRWSLVRGLVDPQEVVKRDSLDLLEGMKR